MSGHTDGIPAMTLDPARLSEMRSNAERLSRGDPFYGDVVKLLDDYEALQDREMNMARLAVELGATLNQIAVIRGDAPKA